MRAVIVLSLVASAGCGNRTDALVVVELTSAQPMSGIARVHTHSVAGGRSSDFDLSAKSAVATPLSFGIDLPPSIGDIITLHVEALSASGAILASGDGSGTIAPGARSDISIVLGGGAVGGNAGGDLAGLIGDLGGASDDMSSGSTGDMAGTAGMPDLALPDMMAVAPASVHVSPSPFAFPGGPHGTLAQTQKFTISNNGMLPTAKLAAATIGGANANANAFAITSDGCNGQPLAGTPCTISVAFTPQLTGAHAATLNVVDGNANTLATATLTGTGTPVWTREYSAASSGNTLRSVFASGAHAWAVGDAGAFVGRNSNGTWTSYPQTNTWNLAFITGTGPTDMWIGAGTVGLFHSTGDGFLHSAEGIPGSGASVVTAIAFAANDVWAIVSSTSSSTTTDTFYHYSGTQFGSSTVSVPTGTSYLWGTSDSNLYGVLNATSCALGECSTTPSIIYGSTTQGFTSQQYSPGTFAGFAGVMGLIWGSSANDVYCGSGLGRPLHSTGDGSWVAVDTSAPAGIVAIWGSSASDVFFVSGSGVYRGDGNMWSPITIGATSFAPAAISGTGPNDVYLVGSDKDGYCVYHWF